MICCLYYKGIEAFPIVTVRLYSCAIIELHEYVQNRQKYIFGIFMPCIGQNIM